MSITLDLMNGKTNEDIALNIAHTWDRWNSGREEWSQYHQMIREYVFGKTLKDTKSNADVHRNKVLIPKLTQIYDNLGANYESVIFGGDEWFGFESEQEEASLIQQRRIIEGWVRTKTRQQKIRPIIRELINDWILYGNCFARLVYVNENQPDQPTKFGKVGYKGAKIQRISPYDIVFNPMAPSFSQSPKIIRTLKSLGQLAKEIKTMPNNEEAQKIFKQALDKRVNLGYTRTMSDQHKYNPYKVDGTGNMEYYVKEGLVEVLEFIGDLFIEETGELLENHIITVIDRNTVISMKSMEGWSTDDYLYHCSWRSRPDNLWGMSPLDNLVGLQHRINTLENKKSDVIDLIAYPTVVEYGNIEYYDSDNQVDGVRGKPGGRYKAFAPGEGDVKFLNPDTTMLQSDLLIGNYMQWIEEMAGAPKQAMGFRTPGEKTKFEVSTLETAAMRVFIHKVKYLEEQLIEPLLNGMVEMSRRMLDDSDIIKIIGQDGEDLFLNVTRENLAVNGKIYAKGSAHFEREAKVVQTLSTVVNTPLYQTIAPHISGKRLAHVIEDLLGIEKYGLVQDNVGIEEQIETQQIAQTGQRMNLVQEANSTLGLV